MTELTGRRGFKCGGRALRCAGCGRVYGVRGGVGQSYAVEFRPGVGAGVCAIPCAFGHVSWYLGNLPNADGTDGRRRHGNGACSVKETPRPKARSKTQRVVALAHPTRLMSRISADGRSLLGNMFPRMCPGSSPKGAERARRASKSSSGKFWATSEIAGQPRTSCTQNAECNCSACCNCVVTCLETVRKIWNSGGICPTTPGGPPSSPDAVGW